ncbi:MAG TPA: prepilin-type N-terminal cleavage/methylation domain-containing protein [Burkholderiaceae bacterium]|nr:prepilin-type N-terminal cleavage/methylation domain-containing protein [Burkholderiaceae bacterium]
MSNATNQRGVTLIEVLVCILIVSAAVGAIVNLLRVTVGNSGDPLIRRQSLAINQALIQEIDTMPFSATDPRTGAAEGMGPEPGESRGSATTPFDDPRDYAGYTETGIVTPSGTAIAGLSQYSASVAVSQQAMGNVPSTSGVLVTVTVTGPNGESFNLYSFRAMYAP